MIISCAWCKKHLGEKEPLKDPSVTHSICKTCMAKLAKKNPPGEWVQTVKGKVFTRLVGGVLCQIVQKEARAWRVLQGRPISDGLMSEGTFSSQEEAFAKAALLATSYVVSRNPGESWHTGKMEEAERSERSVKKASLKDFYHGKAIAHFESALEERSRTRTRKNPIAVFGLGNPPKEIHAKVEGIVYRRCLEVKAEKTGSWNTGLWKHPFAKKSRVQILALDNGDLLLHSAANVRLWKTG